MLLSTLKRYVEGMGGALQLVAQFPNRPPMVIDHIGGGISRQKPGGKTKCLARSSKAVAA